MNLVTRTYYLLHGNHKGADQPVLPCSLISVFVIFPLENIMTELATCKSHYSKLVSVAEQADLSLTWLETLMSYILQGSHRLEKILNIQGFLEKSLKIKFALKSTGKAL